MTMNLHKQIDLSQCLYKNTKIVQSTYSGELNGQFI